MTSGIIQLILLFWLLPFASYHLCHFLHSVILILSLRLYWFCTLAVITAVANETLTSGKNTHMSNNILLTSPKLNVETSCGNPAAVKYNCWCFYTAAEKWQQNTTMSVIIAHTLTESKQISYSHDETTAKKILESNNGYILGNTVGLQLMTVLLFNLSIIFSINWLIDQIIKCQKILKRAQGDIFTFFCSMIQKIFDLHQY